MAVAPQIATEAQPQTRSGKPLESSSGRDNPPGGSEVPFGPLRLQFGPLIIGSYRIISSPLNFTVERLTLAARHTSQRGWGIWWETVGHFGTFGGACQRILSEQISHSGHVDSLEKLLQIVDGLAAKINAECIELNKAVYLKRDTKKKTNKGSGGENAQ